MLGDIRQDLFETINKGGREGFEALRRIAIVLAEANLRLCKLQIEAAEAALSENSKLITSLLRHAEGTPSAHEQLSALLQKKAERFVVLCASFSETTSQTIDALNQLIDESPEFTTPDVQQESEVLQEAFAERRVSARMIVFPERRNRAVASELALEPVQYDAEIPLKRNRA